MYQPQNTETHAVDVVLSLPFDTLVTVKTGESKQVINEASDCHHSYIGVQHYKFLMFVSCIVSSIIMGSLIDVGRDKMGR